MQTIDFTLNDISVRVETDKDQPLLWVLRDSLNMKGTKFGCGIGQCGACSVLMDGRVVRACLTRMDAVNGKSVTTIEGIAGSDDLHPVQKAWIKEQVPQCGYCQSGQIITAISLLRQSSNPTDNEIIEAMSGNLCRCGTYLRVFRAIKRAIESTQNSQNHE